MDFPILPSNVIEINKQLINHFGIETSTGEAMWRVVWSADQFEHRLVDCDDNGNFLQQPEVRYVPKYVQWVGHKWVLERLVAVPIVNMVELPGLKLSYEPMFPFENDKEEAIQPSFEGAKFVIDLVHAAMGEGNLYKYKEGNSQEAKEKRVAKLQKELFGNETDVGDALAHKEGVSLYHKEN